MYSVNGIAFNEAKMLGLFRNVDVDLMIRSGVDHHTARPQDFKPSSLASFAINSSQPLFDVPSHLGQFGSFPSSDESHQQASPTFD